MTRKEQIILAKLRASVEALERKYDIKHGGDTMALATDVVTLTDAFLYEIGREAGMEVGTPNPCFIESDEFAEWQIELERADEDDERDSDLDWKSRRTDAAFAEV